MSRRVPTRTRAPLVLRLLFGLASFLLAPLSMAQGFATGGLKTTGERITGVPISPSTVTASGAAPQFICTDTGTCEIRGAITAANASATVAGITLSPTTSGITLDANDLLVDVKTKAGGTTVFSVDLEGDVKGGAGTAALPSITFVGDTNTGIYNPNPDQLGFSVNGVLQWDVIESGVLRGQSTTTNNEIRSATAASTATSALPALVIKADNALDANDLVFGVRSSTNTNLFTTDQEGDIEFAGVAYANSASGRFRITNNNSYDANNAAGTQAQLLRIDSSDDVVLGNASGTAYDDFFIDIAGKTTKAAFVIKETTGNLGLNISSPASQLHVAETTTNTPRGIVVDQHTANSSGSNISLRKSRNATVGSHTVVQSGDTAATLLALASDGTGFINLGNIRFDVDGTPGTNDMPGRIVFNTTLDGASSVTEQMRIDNVGNVLVNDTASRLLGPGATASRLQITGTSSNAGFSVSRYSADTGGAIVNIGKSRGASAGTYTVVASGDAVGTIFFAAADGADLVSETAFIRSEVDATPGANDTPGNLIFATTADGAATATERMRINNAGLVTLKDSLTGAGAATTTFTITSDTNDATTSATVAALTLRPSVALTASDLVLNVENSAGSNLFTVDQEGDVVVLNDIDLGGGEIRSTLATQSLNILGQINNTTATGTVAAIALRSTSTLTAGDLIVSVRESGGATNVFEIASDGSTRGTTMAGKNEATAPAEPFACAVGKTGHMQYVRDTDIGATNGEYCVCTCDGQGTPVCDWVKLADSTAACPYF